MLAFFGDHVKIFQRLLYGNLLHTVMLLFHRMCSKQIKKKKRICKEERISEQNNWKSCRQFIVCIMVSYTFCTCLSRQFIVDQSWWIVSSHWCSSYWHIQHLWDHQDLSLGLVAEAVFHVMVCLERKGHLWIILRAVYSRHWRGTCECIILGAVFKALKCWVLSICLLHRSDLVVSL